LDINLVKWGNSAAIRIPKKILDKLNIDSNNMENISFDVNVKGDRILLIKKQNKTKFELLVEQSDGVKMNPKTDIDWGNPVGKEEW
jgi:antitoxin MazE